MKNMTRRFVSGGCAVLSLILATSPLYAEKTNIWNVENGFLGEAANWDPARTPDINGRERWDISNNGTATVSAGQTCALGIDLLIATSTRSGTLVLDGDGSVQIKRFLSIGHSAKGVGTVHLKDTSSLSIANGEIGVGQRGTGTLTVAKGATLTVEKGNIYISEGESGDMSIAGTAVTPFLNFGMRKDDTSDHHGKLTVEPGGKLTVTKELNFNGTGEFVFRVIGSGGTITTGAVKANPATVFQFEADANGVTPIDGESTFDISEAKLAVNIDAYKFPSSSSKVVLIKAQSLTGKFKEVSWLGKNKATVNYDAAKGEVTISPAR